MVSASLITAGFGLLNKNLDVCNAALGVAFATMGWIFGAISGVGAVGLLFFSNISFAGFSSILSGRFCDL